MNNFSLITVTGVAAVAAALYYILFGPKQDNSKPTKEGKAGSLVDILIAKYARKSLTSNGCTIK